VKPKIVPAEFWTIEASPVSEEVIGVEDVVAEEVVSAAVKLAGAAARDHRDLARGTAPVLGKITGAEHVELGD
jgi:hypothetical protein